MGTFASFYQAKDSHIMADKHEEFENRVKKIFHEGGMMEVEEIYLHNEKITLIKPIEIHEYGIDIYYNYFEDSFWENAGYSQKEGFVWSNKVGGRFFLKTVLAAYQLQEYYTEGICATLLDANMIIGGHYIGWLNYLFNEKYLPKNFDPWKLFESYYLDEAFTEWNAYEGTIGYSFIGSCEIHSVLYGTASALEKYGREDLDVPETLALNAMKRTLLALHQYAAESDQNRENQLKQLMYLLRTYYQESPEHSLLNSLEGTLKNVLTVFQISDAPAFAVKAISEIYEKNFWELWSEIMDVVKRKSQELYDKKGLYVCPISTEDFFSLSPDDMIFYWTPSSNILFSDDLLSWFKELKKRFDHWMETDFTIEKPLTYLLNLMKEADRTYYRIYTFSNFFEETLEHLQDKQYQVFWKLYEEMIYDPKLQEAGKVIFFDKKISSVYDWDWMESERKNNKARVTLRRYMALMANRPLRKNVLGI